MGIVCLLSGMLVVGIDAFLLLGRSADLRTWLLGAATLGAVTAGAAFFGTLVGSAFHLRPQVGLYLTLIGSIVAVAGAAIHLREGPSA
jgi:hypothetical protein